MVVSKTTDKGSNPLGPAKNKHYYIMWYWIIGFILVLVSGCIASYKHGRVNELHNTRAAFERYEDAHKIVRSREIEEVVRELEDELNSFL